MLNILLCIYLHINRKKLCMYNNIFILLQSNNISGLKKIKLLYYKWLWDFCSLIFYTAKFTSENLLFLYTKNIFLTRDSKKQIQAVRVRENKLPDDGDSAENVFDFHVNKVFFSITQLLLVLIPLSYFKFKLFIKNENSKI